jgi:hypothetical protein
MIGRIIRLGGGYHFMGLSENEYEDVVKSLIKENLRIFTSIYWRASNLQATLGVAFERKQIIDIALSILDKTALNSSAVFDSVLSKKINTIRNHKKAEEEDSNSAYEQEGDALREQGLEEMV